MFVLDESKSEISGGLLSDSASIDKGIDILKTNTATKTEEQVAEILRHTKPRAGEMIQKETSQVGKVRGNIIITYISREREMKGRNSQVKHNLNTNPTTDILRRDYNIVGLVTKPAISILL